MNKKIVILAAALTLGFSPIDRAEDKAPAPEVKLVATPDLAKLLTSEDWQPVITGIGFSDGLSADPATGNIYFSDMKASAIYTVSPELEKKKLADAK